MELWREILCTVLEHQTAEVIFPNLRLELKEIVELTSYQALQRIKEILDNETWNDAECYQKIEQVIQVFESLGDDSISRHDFGKEI